VPTDPAVASNWIIASHNTTGEVAIWLLNDGQISSTANLSTIPATWTIQGINAD
jgi:hypothetical protein